MMTRQGRPSTIAPAWIPLVNYLGSVDAVRESLGIPQSTFYRAVRGAAKFPPEKRETLQILCDMADVPNPLDAEGPPTTRAKDLAPLRALGMAIARGAPPRPATLIHLQQIFPTHQLTELAESDGTPPDVLRAVQVLLEYEPEL